MTLYTVLADALPQVIDPDWKLKDFFPFIALSMGVIAAVIWFRKMGEYVAGMIKDWHDSDEGQKLHTEFHFDSHKTEGSKDLHQRHVLEVINSPAGRAATVDLMMNSVQFQQFVAEKLKGKEDSFERLVTQYKADTDSKLDGLTKLIKEGQEKLENRIWELSQGHTSNKPTHP